jgi:hypothetical protein
MTSRSSKNRQTTPQNTHRWKTVEFVALATAALLTLAPLGRADDPVPSDELGNAPRGANQSQPTERWKRLKSRYHYQPPMVTRSTQPGQISPSTPANAPADSFRPIQSEPGTSSDDAGKSALSDLSSTPRTFPAANDSDFNPFPETAAQGSRTPDKSPDNLPEISEKENADWPPTPKPTRSPKLAERFDQPNAVSGDSGQPIREVPQPENPSVPPAPEQPGDKSYKNTTDEKSPPDAAVRNRSTSRPAVPTVPSGPPRKTTEVRPMSQITPMKDDDLDRDIREYANKMSREWNVQFGGEKYPERQFPNVLMPWAVPSSKYYPLYFQDPALERYGHTYPALVQPVASSARVAAQLVMLPYQMAIRPPWQLESPLGWYRPGEVAPKLHYQIPWNTKAAVVEAATVTGLIFLIP